MMSGPGPAQTKKTERTTRPRSAQPFWTKSGPVRWAGPAQPSPYNYNIIIMFYFNFFLYNEYLDFILFNLIFIFFKFICLIFFTIIQYNFIIFILHNFIFKNIFKLSSTDLQTTLYRRYFTKSCKIFTAYATITNIVIPSMIYRWKYRRNHSVSIFQRVWKK